MTRAPAAAALLVLLSIPVLFWDLGRYGPSNMDELFYHWVARHMLETGNWLRLEYTGEHRLYDTFLNAPLFYWAKAGVIALLGDGWLAMRLPSALCGLGSVLMTWHLVRRIESPAAGLLAGLIQLTTFQFVYLHSARTGEMETAVTLLMTVCAYLFLRALLDGRGFWGHHLCLVALAHVKLPLAVLPLLAELAWFGLHRPARARFRDWLVSGLVLLPLALAWRVYQAVAHWDGFLEIVTKMLGQASGEDPLVSRRHGGVAGNLRFYAATLLFGAFPWSLLYPLGVIGMLRREGRGTKAVAWRLLGLYGVAVFGFFLLVSKHFPWYVIPAYPFLSAFTGAWLWRLWREGPRPWELAALGAALALALFLRLAALDYDPFAAPSRELPPLGWGAPAGVPAAWGLPLAALALGAGGWVWGRRGSAGVPASRAAAAIVAVCLAVAGVRVLAPLRFTGYEAPVEALRRRVDELRARGEPVPYPLVYAKTRGEFGLMKLRYFFWEDFWIVPREAAPGERRRVVELYERSRGDPPVGAPSSGGDRG